MDKREVFLQEVRNAPDDDVPRLVFADWLEDQGDIERAEFIQIQCALAKMPASDPRRNDFEQREQHLLEEFAWIWAEEFGHDISMWNYHRGFIEQVEMTLDAPAEHLLGVLQKAPIRHLRDVNRFDDFRGLVDVLPHLDHLTGLEIWELDNFDNTLVNELLSSPHLQNLRTLILVHHHSGELIDEQLVVEALRSPIRSNLEELAINVDGDDKGPSCAILRALAESPYLRNLRKLTISNAGDTGDRPQMDAETMRLLGRSLNLANLKELDMGRASFPLEAWDEILHWPFLSNLQWFRLYHARQVVPPQTYTIANLRDLSEHCLALEQACDHIDWATELVDPWNSDRCWEGFSWGELKQKHLFAMWPFLKANDLEGLEKKYRDDCQQFANLQVTEQIDALPFEQFTQSIRGSLTKAVVASRTQEQAKAIYFRLLPGPEWDGEFHVSEETEPEPFKPHSLDSYAAPLAEFSTPPFPQAGEIWYDNPPVSLLYPGMAQHYLFARTLAAFARLLREQKPLVPVYLSFRYAVFKMPVE